MVNLRQAFRHQPPDTSDSRVQRYIVPVSGGTEEPRFFEIVRRIAERRPVDITLVYVVEIMQSMPLDSELPNELQHGEAVLKAAENAVQPCLEHKRGVIRSELLQARSAGAAIVDEAIEHQAHGIVIGATTRKRHGRITLGETVEYVLLNAPCEVVVIRHEHPSWSPDHAPEAGR